MKDYYLLIGLDSKEFNITGVRQNRNDLVEVFVESKKQKVMCPIYNKYTSSEH